MFFFTNLWGEESVKEAEENGIRISKIFITPHFKLSLEWSPHCHASVANILYSQSLRLPHSERKPKREGVEVTITAVSAHWVIGWGSQCQRQLKARSSLTFSLVPAEGERNEFSYVYECLYHRSYTPYIGSFFHKFFYTERSFCLLFYVHNKPGHLFSTQQQRTEEKNPQKRSLWLLKGV
jgi:hypothetical protein